MIASAFVGATLIASTSVSNFAFAQAPTLAQARPVEVALIPYYAWANRNAGQMQVWLRAR
ncbi:MAG: hypothetical protein M3Y13_08760 [Armatimonadota bacterium]|nr:hypothetical protein [Armatimonadota bacterium]